MNAKESEMHEAILKWATDHFGHCSPTITEGAGGLVLAISHIEGGIRRQYQVPMEPMGGGLFKIQGVTVDTNTVH
jgi:hypothetical protein